MPNSKQLINALRNPDFRRSLDENINHPAGKIELNDQALKGLVGGNTVNSLCQCVSDDGSCGRICTATGECPITTFICC